MAAERARIIIDAIEQNPASRRLDVRAYDDMVLLDVITVYRRGDWKLMAGVSLRPRAAEQLRDFLMELYPPEKGS